MYMYVMILTFRNYLGWTRDEQNYETKHSNKIKATPIHLKNPSFSKVDKIAIHIEIIKLLNKKKQLLRIC